MTTTLTAPSLLSPRGTTRLAAAWLVAPLVAVLAFAGGVPAATANSALRHAVIVEAGSVQAARAAVTDLGGRVDTTLGLVHAVAAHVDDLAYSTLMHEPALRVTPDIVLHATGTDFKASATATDSQLNSLNPGPTWSLDTGDGVGVALIDTGVNPTADLRGDRLVRGPDFSPERDGVDRYGHGTFMAGLIAGDGTASSSGGVRHVGSAPGSTLISVKVAGADGSTTLSRLIGAIGWVITHEDDYDIGVLNLSFGADANLSYLANPLSGAVEAAWASGITVVTSAGNGGAGTISSPGDDPWVITVGSTDSNKGVLTSDNPVASFSGQARFARYSKPDVLAPGVSVVSLRAPGSTVDVANPNARVGSTYFRGSGTSMSTALVSGAAAALLDRHPDATPDDVKGALLDGGIGVKGATAPAVSLAGADQATPRADWWQRFPIAFGGLGRGLNSMPWTASRWTASRWTASRWTASRWTASRWTASRWTASRWTASRWTASRWTDSDWNDAAWAASRWTASRWTDASWNALAWG